MKTAPDPVAMPRPRAVARIFTPAPLDPQFPNGFSGRWFHFLRALGARFELDVVAVRGIWHEPTLSADAFRPRLPLRSFRTLDAIPWPRWVLRRPWLPFYLTAAALSQLNTRRFGPRVAGRSQASAPAPDVAVFFTHYLAHFAFELPRDVRCVFVLEEGLVRTLHTNLPAPESLRNARRLWRAAMQGLATWRYIRFVQRCARRGLIVAISDEERQWFSQWLPPDRITVIPNGLDPDEYEPRQPAPDHDIAIFGDLSQARNYVPALELIELARQRDDCRNLRWLLVGRSPAPALKALAGENVTITGTVEDTRPYYPRARVVVVPARMVTGSKSTVLKSWAMQRPVVTTLFGTAGLPARPGKNLLVGDDAPGILDAVLTLLRDPARADSIAAAGRKTLVEECNQNRQAESFAALCNKLLPDTAGHSTPRR